MTLIKEHFASNYTRGDNYFALEMKGYFEKEEGRGEYTLEMIKLGEGDFIKYEVDTKLWHDNKQPPIVRLKNNGI